MSLVLLVDCVLLCAAFSDYGNFVAYGIKCPGKGFACEIITAMGGVYNERTAFNLFMYDMHIDGPLKIVPGRIVPFTPIGGRAFEKVQRVPRIMMLHQATTTGTESSMCMQGFSKMDSACRTYGGKSPPTLA